MKTAMFIFCLVTAVCSLLFVHFMLTEISSAWRWIFIIPALFPPFSTDAGHGVSARGIKLMPAETKKIPRTLAPGIFYKTDIILLNLY